MKQVYLNLYWEIPQGQTQGRAFQVPIHDADLPNLQGYLTQTFKIIEAEVRRKSRVSMAHPPVEGGATPGRRFNDPQLEFWAHNPN